MEQVALMSIEAIERELVDRGVFMCRGEARALLERRLARVQARLPVKYHLHTQIDAIIRTPPRFTLLAYDPSYTHVPTARGTLMSVSQDVMRVHILPHLDDESVFSVMFTTRVFQASAHGELVRRTTPAYNTPMALSVRWFYAKREPHMDAYGQPYQKYHRPTPSELRRYFALDMCSVNTWCDALAAAVRVYGCVDNVRTVRQMMYQNKECEREEAAWIASMQPTRIAEVNAAFETLFNSNALSITNAPVIGLSLEYGMNDRAWLMRKTILDQHVFNRLVNYIHFETQNSPLEILARSATIPVSAIASVARAIARATLPEGDVRGLPVERGGLSNIITTAIEIVSKHLEVPVSDPDVIESIYASIISSFMRAAPTLWNALIYLCVWDVTETEAPTATLYARSHIHLQGSMRNFIAEATCDDDRNYTIIHTATDAKVHMDYSLSKMPQFSSIHVLRRAASLRRSKRLKK